MDTSFNLFYRLHSLKGDVYVYTGMCARMKHYMGLSFLQVG